MTATPILAQDAGLVNLSLQEQQAIPTASDSLEGNYNTMAGAFADGDPATAWVTGRDMQDHWARVEWRNTAVTIQRVELDFTPQTLKFKPQMMFGERQAPPERQMTTVKPAGINLQALTPAGWKVLHSETQPLTWNGTKLTITPATPLQGVTRLQLQLASKAPDELFALRELQIHGPKPVTGYALKPKWQAAWLWGELEPQLATFGPVRRYFRRVFDLPDSGKVRSAKLLFVAHDRGRVWLNGTQVARTIQTGAGMNRQVAREVIPTTLFKPGRNLLAIEGEDIEEVGLRGVLAELWLQMQDGSLQVVATDPATFQFAVNSRPGWNSTTDGFEDWSKAMRMRGPNSEVPWMWSVDYTPAYFSGEVQITGVELAPAVPKAGEAFTMKVSARVDTALRESFGLIAEFGEIGPVRPNYVNFSRGDGFIPAAQGLPKGFTGEKTLTISGVWSRGVTPYLPVFFRFANGRQQLQVIPGPVGEVTSGEMPGQLRVDLGTPLQRLPGTGFADANIPQGGRLSINGVAVPPILYTSALQVPGHYAEYLKTGVHLYRIVPQGAGSVIPDDGDEDQFYSRLLHSIKVQTDAILSIDPAAKFLLFVELDMPNDWKFENPEDIILLGNGSTFQPNKFRSPSIGQIQETPNSPAVLQKVRSSLKDFVSRLEKQSYAPSVFGLILTHGRAGENYWGTDINILTEDDGTYSVAPRSQLVWGDFGIAARRSFRDWLKQRYGTKENLARAWKLKEIDFEDVVSPLKWPVRRFTSDLVWRNRPAGRFMFRDRTAEGALFHDFARHQNEARAELFIEAGKVIKSASQNRLLVGGYIGYVLPNLTNSPPGLAQHSGHLAMRKVLECPYIDILCSPHFYHMRRQGDPIMPMGITDSLRAHGKLWINEYDSRTYLSPISPKTFSQRETVEVFQKEFGNAITRDQGWWWLEFNFNSVGKDAPSWFADEKLIADAAVMRRLYEKQATTPALAPSSEIAVFLNVEQPYYTDVYSPGNTVHSNIVNGLIPRLSMLGAPFDLYAQADLAKLKARGWLKQYKLVLFVNAFHLDAAERAIIDSDLKRDGKTLLFFFAPGFQGNSDPNTELAVAGIESVTGMKGVRKLQEQHIIGMALTDHPTNQGIKTREFDALGWPTEDQIKSYSNEIGPVFYLENAAANGWQPLANLRVDKSSDPSKVAIAQLKSADFTSIYSVIPDLPADVLTNIAARSGVHIYSRPDVLTWANENFLTVHTGRAAKQIVLRAKEPVTWIEPFERKVYAQKTNTLTIDLEQGETKFFCLEKNGEWRDFVR